MRYMKGVLLIDELQSYAELIILFAFILRAGWHRRPIVLQRQENGSSLTMHHVLSQVSYPDTIKMIENFWTNHRPILASKTINCVTYI